MIDNVRTISVVYAIRTSLDFLENLYEESSEQENTVLISMLPVQIAILEEALDVALEYHAEGKAIDHKFYAAHTNAVQIADIVVKATSNG